MISEGLHKLKRVEVYLMKIFVFRMSAMPPAASTATTPLIEISKTAKVEELIDQVVQLSVLDRDDLRYWQVEKTALEERPLEGTFYPSHRLQQDETQPFDLNEQKGKRLDEALWESGDAIVYEYRSQGTWTVDMGSLELAKRTRTAPTPSNAPTFFNTEAFKAKYNSPTYNAIKPISPGTGFTPTSSQSTTSTALTVFQGSSSSYGSNGRFSSYTPPSRSPGTVGLNNL
jgi:hypothetical protein